MGKIDFELTNDLEELEVLCKHVSRFCKSAGIVEKDQFQINLALDELFTNIISHGFQDGQPHRIRITVDHQGGEVVITIEDDGISFNPLDLPAPDLKCDLKERGVGGLGITLIKAFMDQVRYRRQKDKNILVLKKKVNS